MPRKFILSMGLMLLVVLAGVVNAQAKLFSIEGVVPPSACRVGGVESTEQFTSTGFSNVKTAGRNDEIVAGAWVIVNNHVPDTSIILPPNCNAPLGAGVDGAGLNLMAVRLMPTYSSAAEADIREVKLIWDINADTLWDPLVDLVIDVLPGSTLDTQDGAVFFHGPQSPLAYLANTTVECDFGQASPQDAAPTIPNGIGPANGTNSRNAQNGCYIPLIAVVVIGDEPQTGTQFGLELEALAGDIPGTTGVSNTNLSSGFSSSVNPKAANIRVHMVGGVPSSFTPIEHISNSSGNPESGVSVLTFTGGQAGEGLLTRFRDLEIVPGTREVIAMAVGLCDGGFLASTNAPILPPIAGTPPTIAGGLASLPCVPSANTDGFATGINGATLIFRGPLAKYMGTVRFYVDECVSANIPQFCAFIGGGPFPGAFTQTPITDAGGGDGFLFAPGELAQQAVPIYNEETGEAIVQFGRRQGQVLLTRTGFAVAHGSDPICNNAAAGCTTSPGVAGTRPLILIFTVDIDSNAPGGIVDVLLGLQSYDDTAWNGNDTAPSRFCRFFAFAGGISAPTVPLVPGAPTAGSCASNFLDNSPEFNSFTVEAPVSPSTPNNLTAFDTNDSCFIDDPEMFSMIDSWVDMQIGDTLFFNGVDVWVVQENICVSSASNSVSALKLNNINIDKGYNSTTFSVTGQAIERMGIEIFGLNGELIYSAQNEGTGLTWNNMTRSGGPVANGTYLYTVSVEGPGGQITSEVQKLVVLR